MEKEKEKGLIFYIIFYNQRLNWHDKLKSEEEKLSVEFYFGSTGWGGGGRGGRG